MLIAPRTKARLFFAASAIIAALDVLYIWYMTGYDPIKTAFGTVVTAIGGALVLVALGKWPDRWRVWRR